MKIILILISPCTFLVSLYTNLTLVVRVLVMWIMLHWHPFFPVVIRRLRLVTIPGVSCILIWRIAVIRRFLIGWLLRIRILIW